MINVNNANLLLLAGGRDAVIAGVAILPPDAATCDIVDAMPPDDVPAITNKTKNNICKCTIFNVLCEIHYFRLFVTQQRITYSTSDCMMGTV